VSEMGRITLHDSRMMAMIPRQHGRDIVLSLRIKADRSRVLKALSIPEYIEAWLQTPDAEESHFVFNPVAQEAFHIDLYLAEALRKSIDSTCHVVSANRVIYTWKTTSRVGTTETLVEMQLLCCSGGCILGLNHTGFKDTVESVWCCKMWQQSMERLSRLMGKN